MSKDPIVDEIRSARESEAAKDGFNVNAILLAAKKRPRRTKHPVVSLRKNQKLRA
jgi:hypothetical protein